MLRNFDEYIFQLESKAVFGFDSVLEIDCLKSQIVRK